MCTELVRVKCVNQAEQPTHLYWRRLAREHPQFIIGGVARQLHQDIHAIVSNFLRNQLLVRPKNVLPDSSPREDSLSEPKRLSVGLKGRMGGA